MSREECFAEFEEDKLVLLKRPSTIIGLVGFTSIPSISRLAIGIAVKTDLHRDGDNLYLSPFEAEMRRRLWWHICILDIHTAEDGASVPCIQDSLFNTRLPTNVNDVNLDPQMSVPPVAQTGKTEMLFSLVRFEVSYFARQIVFPDQFCQDNGYKVLSPLEKCEAIDRFQRSIETRYLVHCDKRVPLDFIITTSTRLVLVRFKLTVTKPRSGQNQNQNHLAMPGNFRGICVELLQQSHDLRRCEKARHWLWLFQSYVEWEALACLLLDLCLTPSRTVADLVWTTVNKIYRYWKQRGGDTGRCRRWENIEGLYAQAVAIRDSVPPSSQLSEATGQRHEIPNVASPEHLSRIWELANAAATAGLNGPSQPVSAEDAAEMPTAGTLCEWSAGVFGQYFGLIDSGKDKST
ncbi:hypothetical protein EYZ11_000733 [Aspergillus tanneri]|uniref:Xylanolytic transcriptional activator regulatory domain-containing protein n=1 Tax=Aspergillus tanneri TaxID=1220188 RepID=A0A4S3JWR3_9EURO|nr:hypothetical protein EYZ11_000733 [Aspergillus tanneri]